MTLLIEAPSLQLMETPERPRTAEELETAVMDLALELDDPTSDLHQRFYGEEGVTPTLLQDVRRPVSGHTLLAKNETSHTMKVDGKEHNAATFKRRGAFLAATLAEQANPGLENFVTASAGNHALGIAFAAKRLGKQAHIYCRKDISEAKLVKMQELGAHVHNGYDTLEEAMEAAKKAGEPNEYGQQANHFIHPYDQVEVIAGQATVGLELLRDLQSRAKEGQLDLHNDVVEITVPRGGGGLVAGVSVVMKYAREAGLIGKNVRVVAVQMEPLADGKPNTWCDGTAVETPGELAGLVLRDERYVQAVETVSELDLAHGMHELTGVYNKMVEPAGSLAYAGAKKRSARIGTPASGVPKTTFVPLVTGANVSAQTYEHFRQVRDDEYTQRLHALGSLVNNQPAYRRDPIAARQGGHAMLSGYVLRTSS